MDTHSTNVAVRNMWAIILVSFVSLVYVHSGMSKWVNLGYSPNDAADFVWFASVYLCGCLAAYIFVLLTDKLVAKFLLRIMIGKLVDLFIAPYGFHLLELIWIGINVIYYAKKWIGLIRKT